MRLAKPAQRALHHAGISTLNQLSWMGEDEISLLHGKGEVAILEIKKALADQGLSFTQKKK